MMYLPRLLRAHLNPACVASCPLGLDLQTMRGRHRPHRPGQMPRLAYVRLTGCPYKNLLQLERQAEKCIFCYPRIEAGQPTVCFETRGPYPLPGRAAL